ncbi:MAG: hypothetical protein ACPIOQ_72080, partial [Promethearchaeia archaeon]
EVHQQSRPGAEQTLSKTQSKARIASSVGARGVAAGRTSWLRFRWRHVHGRVGRRRRHSRKSVRLEGIKARQDAVSHAGRGVEDEQTCQR